MDEINELKNEVSDLREEVRLLKMKNDTLQKVVINQNVQLRKLTTSLTKILIYLKKKEGD